ncbi:MAG: SEL1-like repeat protein [Myxococcales bacterium]|nr:SEL1-like repeat protein [Myxococcales bacterium]
MRDVFGWVGTLVEKRYEVEAVVGEGGFGLVYRAHHRELATPVAVKCLKLPTHFVPEARELMLERFRNEGRMLSKLSQHPNIVRVLDFGIAEHTREPVPYLVLEWLEGASLDALLAERLRLGAGPFDERTIVDIVGPAIDALGFAHELGIAHRDIKPANVFRARTARGETTKILDFGIAKAMHDGETHTEQVTHTSSGFHAFSPPYGAPEQFRPKVFGPTGPWTDVHALGLLLFELATGSRMFEGDEVGDFFVASTSDDRPSPRRRGATVSDAFEALCRRASAAAPKARFQSAVEMLAALRALELGDAPAEPSAPPDVYAHSEALDTAQFLDALPGVERPAAPPALEPRGAAERAGDASPGEERGRSSPTQQQAELDGTPEPTASGKLERRPPTEGSAPGPAALPGVPARRSGPPWLVAAVAAAALSAGALVLALSAGRDAAATDPRLDGSALGATGGGASERASADAPARRATPGSSAPAAGPEPSPSASRPLPGTPEHARLAWRLYDDETEIDNLATGVTEAQASCRAGNADGCAVVGDALRIGRGLEQDVRRAFDTLDRACRDGSQLGCAQLGVMYAEGSAVRKDPEHAVALYDEACRADVPRACVDLGNAYRYGNGVERDHARATELYERGCERGDMMGCRRKGELLDDPAARLPLYRRACDGGEMLGCNYLGDFYRDGRVVEADPERAAELYRKACDRGSIWGCYDLGVLYQYGRGVPKDEARALALAKAACDGHTWGIDGHKKACDWVATRRAPPEPKPAAKGDAANGAPDR